MGNRPEVLKSCSNSSFPFNIWYDILSRIPVRSIVQFRCVSTTWKALIDDPVFARVHLTHSKKIYDESRLLVVQETSRECVVKCSKTLKTTEFLAVIETSKQMKQSTLATLPVCNGEEIRSWNVVSSIDGLIMLVSWDGREQLMLWNPSIRKVRKVPPCPGITPQMTPIDFGMGFDPLTEDYKHVIMVHDAICNLQFIAVYTVGTNSWKKIELRESRADWDPLSCTPQAHEPVCVGGVLYSMYGGTSFDLRSDTYDFNVRYPHITDPRVCSFTLTPADCGRSLALVCLTNDEGYVQVLQGSEWTQRYMFAVGLPKYGCSPGDSPRLLYLKKNGEALLHWGEAITSSNLETHQEERIMLEEDLRKYGFHAWRYDESLILLN